MWTVLSKNELPLFQHEQLSEAMNFAKTVGMFVTITDGTTKIVGKFGADEVTDVLNYDGWISRRNR